MGNPFVLSSYSSFHSPFISANFHVQQQPVTQAPPPPVQTTTPPPPPPTPPPNPPQPSCPDNNKHCSSWKVYCDTNTYVHENCRNTCNTCNVPTPPMGKYLSHTYTHTQAGKSTVILTPMSMRTAVTHATPVMYPLRRWVSIYHIHTHTHKLESLL